MRIAYLDDSGTGAIAVDPYAVMAGVIVTGDLQWKALDDYLRAMSEALFPGQKDVVFHATDIWHGARRFSRERFPDKWRRRMYLLEICQLAQKFDLPVVFGEVDRAKLNAQSPELTARDSLIGSLAICAAQCTAVIESYMRQQATSEVAMVVYENNDITRTLIRKVHNYLKNPAPEDLKPSIFAEYLPIQTIVDTAHFAEKTDSSLLQLADAMAFAISRKLKNAEDCDYLFEVIDKQLIVRHKAWGIQA